MFLFAFNLDDVASALWNYEANTDQNFYLCI